MKIYVAASFLEKEHARSVEDQLVKAGHEITSRWVEHLGSDNPKKLSCEAVEDFYDLKRCDAMVVLLPGRYGTHAELGAAIVLDKMVILVGDVEAERCVYYHHPNVIKTNSVEGAVNALKFLPLLKEHINDPKRELYNI